MLGIPSISSTLIALNLAAIRARLGLRRLLVAGGAAFGFALLGVGLAPTVWGVVVGLLVYGAGEGATVPSLQETTAARAGASQRGMVLATWVAAVRLGQATGPLAFAALFGVVGTGTTLMVGSAVAVGVVALHAFTPMGREPELVQAHR